MNSVSLKLVSTTIPYIFLDDLVPKMENTYQVIYYLNFLIPISIRTSNFIHLPLTNYLLIQSKKNNILTSECWSQKQFSILTYRVCSIDSLSYSFTIICIIYMRVLLILALWHPLQKTQYIK